MERTLFHQVQDVFESFVLDVGGKQHATAHGRGIKVWYDEATKEHYEAQLVRLDGKVVLEIGFHSEHPKVGENQALLDRLLGDEQIWRRELGDEAEAGVFLGVDRWRRISEIWEAPAPNPDRGDTDNDTDNTDNDVDVAIEIAARLADYVRALEPLRRS